MINIQKSPDAGGQSGPDTWMIEVISITLVENRGSLRAFANIRLGDLFINDCRIIQENGKIEMEVKHHYD